MPAGGWIWLMSGRASGSTVGPFTRLSLSGTPGRRYSFAAKTPVTSFLAFWAINTNVLHGGGVTA